MVAVSCCFHISSNLQIDLQISHLFFRMEPMSLLIPRLWPFLSHSTSSVRKSTLQTLKTLTHYNSIVANQETETSNTNGKTFLSTDSTVALEKLINVDSKKLSLNFGVKEWSSSLLQEAMRHIFQRVLIEHVPDIQTLAEDVWVNLVTNAELSALLHASCPFVASWMCLAMQPARLSFDPSLMMTYARPNPSQSTRKRLAEIDIQSNQEKIQLRMYLGGIETVPVDLREKNIPRARCIAAKMLGLLSKFLILPAPGAVYASESESPIHCFTKVLLTYLTSRSALQRLICGMVVSFWAVNDPESRPGPIILQEHLKRALSEQVYYDEVAFLLTRLLQESRDFIATLKQYKIPFHDFDAQKILTLDQINALCTTMTDNLKQKYPFLRNKHVDLLEERRRSLQQSLALTNFEQNGLNVR